MAQKQAEKGELCRESFLTFYLMLVQKLPLTQKYQKTQPDWPGEKTEVGVMGKRAVKYPLCFIP